MFSESNVTYFVEHSVSIFSHGEDIKLFFLNKNSENVMSIIIHRLSSELSVCVCMKVRVKLN